MDEMRVWHGLWELDSPFHTRQRKGATSQPQPAMRARERVRAVGHSQSPKYANCWVCACIQLLSNSARARQHHCMSSLGPTANSSAAQTHSTVRCVPILCAEKLLDSTTCSYGKGNARETKLASFCFEIECIVACVDMPKKKHVGFINW